MNRYRLMLITTASILIALGSTSVMADIASGINYNTDVNCDSRWAEPDEEGVIYGAEDPSRQWLNVYHAAGNDQSSKPVVLYAHPNGSDACIVDDRQRDIKTGAGYTLISWESHKLLTTIDQTMESWEDFNLVVEFLRTNATHFNIDMSEIIVTGRSRGSGASWKFAHSGDSAIRGSYLAQALPDGFWDYPEVWKPLDDISAERSKPMYMVYNPDRPDIDNDSHDPRRGLDVQARYDAEGLTGQTQVITGVAKSDLWDDFPIFLEWLADLEEASPPSPSGFVDDFSAPTLDKTYHTFNGDWSVTEYQRLRNSDRSKAALIINGSGSIDWQDYTVSARVKTYAQKTPGTSWHVARIAGRFTNSRNYYEAYISQTGRLILRSVTDNGSRELDRAYIGDIDVGQWNSVYMSFNGTEIIAGVGDQDLISVSDSDHSRGGAGLKSSFCDCLFDDLAIILD